MKQQYIFEVNTQRGFAGFSLFEPSAEIDTSDLSSEGGGSLTDGFSKQLTDPNGNTYTITVSRP